MRAGSDRTEFVGQLRADPRPFGQHVYVLVTVDERKLATEIESTLKLCPPLKRHLTPVNPGKCGPRKKSRETVKRAIRANQTGDPPRRQDRRPGSEIQVEAYFEIWLSTQSDNRFRGIRKIHEQSGAADNSTAKRFGIPSSTPGESPKSSAVTISRGDGFDRGSITSTLLSHCNVA